MSPRSRSRRPTDYVPAVLGTVMALLLGLLANVATAGQGLASYAVLGAAVVSVALATAVTEIFRRQAFSASKERDEAIRQAEAANDLAQGSQDSEAIYDRLVSPLPVEARFIYAWGQLEQEMRARVGASTESLAGRPLSLLIDRFALVEGLSGADRDQIEKLLRLRNRVVHGDSQNLDAAELELGISEIESFTIRAAARAEGDYRRLSQGRPEEYSLQLARSLSNLATYRSQLGDYSEAVAISRESIGLLRNLATSDPGRYEPDLARALNNSTVVLGLIGDYRGAVDASRETVALYRELAAADPARYTPNVAEALNVLSVSLGQVGDYRGAVDASREAVALYRQLAAADPSKFSNPGAGALRNLAAQLRSVGDEREANLAEDAAARLQSRSASD